ncbi:MAG: CaiB/BaiF CoA transferase family protein [Candidatus Binatales bacterium]
MTLPLEGIRVIDLGQIYAVPYCTMQLAYLGAEVIKIEPPGSGEFLRRPEVSRGGVSYAFLMLNANKKSVTLNLKDARGREILLQLLAGADVMVENYLGGVMESFGLGYEQIAPRFPRLIYASGKGYATGSRWERLPAMDATVQASGGFISVTGFPDGPGMRTPTTFIDMGTGSHLVSAILAALIQRGRTGAGQRVEVAMLDVCVPAMTSIIGQTLDGRKFVRPGNRHWGIVPCSVYPAADGEVVILCLSEAHWRSCAKLIGHEELIADPRYKSQGSRMRIVDEVDGFVSAWTRTLSRAAIVELLIAAGIPCAPVRTIEEIIADQDVAARAMLIDSEFPTRGPIRVLGSPLKLSDAPQNPGALARPPAVGEHNAEVLATVGLDAAALEKLRADGVI